MLIIRKTEHSKVGKIHRHLKINILAFEFCMFPDSMQASRTLRSLCKHSQNIPPNKKADPRLMTHSHAPSLSLVTNNTHTHQRTHAESRLTYTTGYTVLHQLNKQVFFKWTKTWRSLSLGEERQSAVRSDKTKRMQINARFQNELIG